MALIGNILWFIFFGWEVGLSWISSGIVCCITIIGIPLGVQCFKIVIASLFPFGRTFKRKGGAVSVIANIIWLIFIGLWLTIAHYILGAVLCCTIIGIPFGLQCFKIGNLALCPFGVDIN